MLRYFKKLFRKNKEEPIGTMKVITGPNIGLASGAALAQLNVSNGSSVQANQIAQASAAHLQHLISQAQIASGISSTYLGGLGSWIGSSQNTTQCCVCKGHGWVNKSKTTEFLEQYVTDNSEEK